MEKRDGKRKTKKRMMKEEGREEMNSARQDGRVGKER